MLNRSLRSVARPTRSYVCFSCVARSSARFLSTSSAPQATGTESHPDSAEKNPFIFPAVPNKRGGQKGKKDKKPAKAVSASTTHDGESAPVSPVLRSCLNWIPRSLNYGLKFFVSCMLIPLSIVPAEKILEKPQITRQTNRVQTTLQG